MAHYKLFLCGPSEYLEDILFWDIYKSLLLAVSARFRRVTLEKRFNLTNLGADQYIDLLLDFVVKDWQ